MAFWQRWFRPKEEKYGTLDLFREIYGGRPSRTGVSVTWSSALEVATVLSCARVLAEGVAQVPWKLYSGENGKPEATHPVYRLIYRKPNRWQTSFEFRETVMFHAALMGNAYVFVGRVGTAREARELVPLEPQFVSVEKDSAGRLKYKYQPTSTQAVEFDESVIWHIKGASWNGWQGLEAVKLVREAIGLAISAEAAHAEFHKGNARISGMYSVDGNLSKEQYAFIAAWLDKYAMGGERSGKPMILDRGAKFVSQQMTGVDAQHLETRKHQIEEICRAFRVMPIMVGHADKTATYASAEQMFIAHVVHTLLPWYERIEQSADVVLLSEEEQARGLYTKFTPNALMRGSAADRAQYYVAALGNTQQPGWMLKNEIRALEELPPVDGGDEFPPLITQQPTSEQTPNTGDETVKAVAAAFAASVSDMADSTRALAMKESPVPIVNVDVAPPSVTIEGAKIDVQNFIPPKGRTLKTAQFNEIGRITGMIEEEIE